LFLAALTSLASSVIEFLAGDLAAAELELRSDYRRLDEMGERNYISTTAGLLADVLYREGRYDESAEFARVCEHLASPDDVASQFHWRCVRGKLRALEGAADEAKSLLSAAMALIETSDQIDLQGYGLLDFAEVQELSGAPAEAAALSERAAELFERKGNVVSALRARQLAENLRPTPATSLPGRGDPGEADLVERDSGGVENLDTGAWAHPRRAHRSWQVHYQSFAGCEDVDGRGRELRHEAVDFGIGTPQVVVEQRELPGVGALRQCDRILNRRAAEKAQPRQGLSPCASQF
ncbi:MAG: hypothetical protein ACTHPS_26620, partial [Streptosporangiaceae bacterium]